MPRFCKRVAVGSRCKVRGLYLPWRGDRGRTIATPLRVSRAITGVEPILLRTGHVNTDNAARAPRDVVSCSGGSALHARPGLAPKRPPNVVDQLTVRVVAFGGIGVEHLLDDAAD